MEGFSVIRNFIGPEFNLFIIVLLSSLGQVIYQCLENGNVSATETPQVRIFLHFICAEKKQHKVKEIFIFD